MLHLTIKPREQDLPIESPAEALPPKDVAVSPPEIDSATAAATASELRRLRDEITSKDVDLAQLRLDLEVSIERQRRLEMRNGELFRLVGFYREHQTNFHRFTVTKNPFPGSERARESFLSDTIKYAE